MTSRPKRVSPGSRLLVSGRKRLLRLARREELRKLASLAYRRGQRIWIVGGALRDLLLARPLPEVDVAVSGDAGVLAREMEEAGLGTCVALSDASPRVFRVAGQREIDIAELTGGSIEADLARRDFTVNAIACELPARCFLDPLGGAGDLACHRLRAISEENLREDPLRVLRAARLFATHGLVPDRSLTRAAGRAALGLSAAASERVRVELVKLLEAERVSGPLAWLLSVRALAPVLGVDPAAVRGSRFEPAWSRLDARRIRDAEPASRRRLRLCVIADTLGLSPVEAARWLSRRRFSRREASEISALLDLAAGARRAGTALGQWGWVRDAGERRGEALRLLAVLGRPKLARRLAARKARRRVRATGADIVRWLAIPSGPSVGALLREVEIRILSGAVRSRRQARRWLEENRAIAGRSKSRRPEV